MMPATMALSTPKHYGCVYPAMCLFICTLLCPVAATIWSSEAIDVPGVAFSLTPNHGTSAIYFANGSSAKVAYIEGSPQYKAFMSREHPPLREPSWCNVLPDLLQSYVRRLCPKHPDIEAAESHLRALKQSITSHLGTPFCFADMVLPDPSIQVYQRQILETALRDLSLRQPRKTLHAAHLAVSANKLGKPADARFNHQVVLAIDYSSYGLNAVLLCHDGDVIDILRQEYNTSLAASRASDGKQHLEQVKSAVEKVAKSPFGNSVENWPLPSSIQSLVLYGDEVNDAGFIATIKSVLGQQLVQTAFRFDPIFASAVGMAEENFEYMRTDDFDTHPAFWCRWSSKLYSGQHVDL